MRWIEAWSNLYELVNQRCDVKCLLPDGRIVDLEECKGWLQDCAYQGWHVKVEADWVLGEQSIVASCWQG
ncbi:MAG TPA: hypothetical protein V6C95_23285 [Coleofasciculaceae cyanobacterium]